MYPIMFDAVKLCHYVMVLRARMLHVRHWLITAAGQLWQEVMGQHVNVRMRLELATIMAWLTFALERAGH